MNTEETPHEAPGDLPVSAAPERRPASADPRSPGSLRTAAAVKISFAIAVMAIIFGGALRNCQEDSSSSAGYSGNYSDRFAEQADDDELCWNITDCLKKARVYSRTGEAVLAEMAALKACDLGSGEGCYMLGQGIIKAAKAEYEEATGRKARSLRDQIWKGAGRVQESCIAGYPPACEAMARYTGGELPMMKNPARAGEYHTQACELEVWNSCIPAIVFQWQEKKDLKKAWELSRRHCKSGNREACVYYALLAEQTQNPEPPAGERLRWLRTGCDQLRIPGACYVFGLRSDREEAPEQRLRYLNEACALSKNKKQCAVAEQEKRIQDGRNSAAGIAP